MTWLAGDATDRSAEAPEGLPRTVERILGALADRPRRLRVRTADFVLDLDWAPPTETAETTEPAGPPGPAPRPVGHEVLAPSIGTYFRAPSPDSAPFVTEGQRVESGQQVAIVEVMKLMLPVEADVAGTVVELLKADGEPVEYGEPILVLAPHEAA